VTRRDIAYFKFLITAAVVEAAHAAGDSIVATAFIILATFNFWDYLHTPQEDKPEPKKEI
jgi:hypothetical protein